MFSERDDARRGVGAYETPEAECDGCGEVGGRCGGHEVLVTPEAPPEAIGARLCACGRQHGGASWLALRLRGYSGRRDTGREWEALELRECHCGQLLGVVVRWQP